MENKELASIISNMPLLEKICDAARLVDPVGKKVIDMTSGMPSAVHCFDSWGKNKVCDNCISMRAYNDNTTYVKFEYSKDRIFLVTAVPFEYNGKKLVIELMKDTTNSVIFDSDSRTSSMENVIHTLIDGMNTIALKDSLTGAYNRRYIEEKLPVDLVNAGLLSQHISLLMLDVDFFKKVNDQYGHLAGDCVLQGIVETVSGCLKRSSDWIARYGGEEFLICLPGANEKTAAGIAEQIRGAIEKATFNCEKTSISVTVSIGVFHIPPASHFSIEEIIRNADERMYAAKRNGRNQVAL